MCIAVCAPLPDRVKRHAMNELETDVRPRILRAREFYDSFSLQILSMSNMTSLLRGYREEIMKSRLLMEELGLPAICAHCAIHIPGGGCCGPEIASWYDPLTLLMNLLFEIDFPEEPFYPDSCLFLGEGGCILEARYHFCVNYLCGRIATAIPGKALSRLTAQSGRELFTAWHIECILRDFLCSRGVPDNYLDR